MEPVVQILGIEKSFRGHLGIGKTRALRGLSLEVGRGLVFGLLGPNGAGKSTTIKTMLGLLRPDRGEVRLFGGPPSDPRTRARVGYLPEHPYFYDSLTPRELLDLYGRLRGVPANERKRRTEETLGAVGLAGREDLPLRKCSKGMLQRVGLAQAIAHGPDLVILDEPMSGLDPVGRREVRDLILSLRDAGKTVFFSSHILQDAEALCDRVAILAKGEVRAEGTLREMIGGAPRWFEVTLAGDPPRVPGTRVLSAAGGETLVRVDDVDALAVLLAAAREAGTAVVSLWPRRETLEDRFLREIGAGAEGGR